MGAEKYIDPLNVACDTMNMAESMQYPRAGRVHVLRHSFEPNEPLAQLIQDFAGPSLRPRFLLRSSKGVFVDSAAYTRGAYREEDEEIRNTVQRAKKFPIHIAKAAFRLAQASSAYSNDISGVSVAYRLNLLPLQSQSFDELNESLDYYPDSKHAPGPSRHYLYLDLPPQAAFTMSDREGAEHEFSQILARSAHRHLYSATVRDVRAIEVPQAQYRSQTEH